MLLAVLPLMLIMSQSNPKADLAYMGKVAQEVVDSAKVAPGAMLPKVGANRLGYAIRVPGGTKTFYPAFWIRDAAMMLGAHLVPANEVEGWIRVVAKTQPGPDGLKFRYGLKVPAYSIPDHISLKGEACWFPGAYAEQGLGEYGFLPPADDAYYFVQMAWEHTRLTGQTSLLSTRMTTGYGEQPLIDICARAFDSVQVDPDSGMVVCSATRGQGRVDWGFCDSITKNGQCLMPSLLRWQAAKRLAIMFDALGLRDRAKACRETAARIARNLVPVFYHPVSATEGLLISATGLGKKDDVWASAFAVWLGVLPRVEESAVARHLLALVQDGGIVAEGQIRHMPRGGEYGGYWDAASSGRDSYQNGGYWATPTGWLVVALRKVDPKAGDELLSQYANFVRTTRAAGAPFEWVNPYTGAQSNGNYGSSAGLVYAALKYGRNDH